MHKDVFLWLIQKDFVPHFYNHNINLYNKFEFLEN